jgi:hypothetical protein
MGGLSLVWVSTVDFTFNELLGCIWDGALCASTRYALRPCLPLRGRLACLRDGFRVYRMLACARRRVETVPREGSFDPIMDTD